MPFVLDADTWINLWHLYPPHVSVFAPIWKRIEELIDAGELVTPHEVLEELHRGGDGLVAWIGQHSMCVRLLDGPLQASVSAVLARFPDLADAEALHENADAFVVGLAALVGGTVVSNERRRRASGGRFRIPDACDGLSIRAITLLEFVDEVTPSKPQ